jgi:hypothetical protein
VNQQSRGYGTGPADADALCAASINAAAVVSHADTQTGLLKRQAIDERLAAMPAGRIRRWSASGLAL